MNNLYLKKSKKKNNNKKISTLATKYVCNIYISV